ncbi:TIGR03768 family metallophosphoesterase [Methanosphaerula palustris]|nr:TIGR03768 family metallophosphoesterase [Methanosphaerula palustris]
MICLGLVLLFSMLFAGCVNTSAPNNTTLTNTTSPPGFVTVTTAVNHTNATEASNMSVQPNLTPALSGNISTNASLNTTAMNVTMNATSTVNTTATAKANATPTEYFEQDSGPVDFGTAVNTYVPLTTATGAQNVSVLPTATLAPGNLTSNTSQNITPVSTTVNATQVNTTLTISPVNTTVNGTQVNTTLNVTPVSTSTNATQVNTTLNATGITTVNTTGTAAGNQTTVPTTEQTVNLSNLSDSEASYPIDSVVLTTHDRVVLPVSVPSSSPTVLPYDVANYSRYGYGVWQYGQGLDYEKRLDLVSPAYNNTSVSHTANLLHFFDMTDVHISDKETPAQGIFFGYLGGQSSGYSPVMLATTQVLDAAVQTINALHKAEPFDFGISLGDVANNEQYNELRWYIDVLDGKVINPDSGVKDDPVPGPLNDYQDQYKAAGLNTSIPWYQALGNHDHNWIGTNPPDDYLKANYTGEYILNMGNIFVDPLGIKSRGYYMGSIDGRTVNGDIIGVGNVSDFATPPKVLAADPNRRVLSVSDWMGEFFNTSSTPIGHGFNQSDVSSGRAYYSFEPKSDIPIKVIVLDDTQNATDADAGGYGHGSLDNEQFDWLVSELNSGQAEGQLMIIAAHVPIATELSGSSLDEYTGWSSVSQVSEEKLLSTLHEYPNLILWIAGHRHVNAINAQKSPDASHPELGFWEVETSSLRDFPQQFRTFEIVRNSDNTISILTTDVDPAVKEGSIAAKSRSYGVAAEEIFNNSLPYLPSGSYNAELVKQLSTDMQVKIQNYGTPAGK